MGNPLKADTLGWIFGSFLTLYYSEIVTVLKIDPRVGGTYFQLSVATTLVPVLIGVYFIFWLSFYKGIPSEKWEKHSPYAVPVATASAVLSGILWNFALWDVYRFWTPIILFILFMGFIMTVSIIPPWTKND